MRVLLLAQWYAPIIGGEEGHVQALAGTLARRGHAVSVATMWHPGLPRQEVRDGVTVHRLPGTFQRVTSLFADPGRRSAPPFPDPETTWALAQLLRRERPHIVHAHNWLVHSWLPLQAVSGAKLVVTLHDYSLVCAKKNLIRDGVDCPGPALGRCPACAAAHYGPLKGGVTYVANAVGGRLERSWVDLFIPVSRSVQRGVGLADGDSRVRVIPNFVAEPPPMGAGESEELTGSLPTHPYLLYVGSFARQKGIAPLLEAHRRFVPGTPLVLIGYPAADEPPEIGAPPRGVTVLTNWPRAAVIAAMRRAVAVVVPSVWREPCPTVVLEAMLAGAPVIASRIGGIPELVDDGQAMLVEPGNVEALGAAMARVVAEPQLRERLEAAGRRRVMGFRAEAVVDRIEQAYRDVRATPDEGALSR